MSTTLIDCGQAVIKITMAEDHVHLTIISQSFTGTEGYHEPAESAEALLHPDEAQRIIDALASFAKTKKPTLKAVTKETPH